MLKLRPPNYKPSEPSVFYSPRDPSWKLDRINAEKDRLVSAAIKLLPANATDDEKAKAAEQALAKHPVVHWSRGYTKFCPSAPLTVPERLRSSFTVGDGDAKTTFEGLPATVRIADYLDGDPTRFVLRRLPIGRYHDLTARLVARDKSWVLLAVRWGLERIENPDFELGRNHDGSLDDETLDGLFYSGDEVSMMAVATAILHLCQKWEALAESEGKP